MSEEILKRLVPPHAKMSREATEDDIDRVVEESKILYLLCFQPTGKYKGAYATHHAQIDDKDPLNFFVTADKQIVINPTITRHTKTTVDSTEACMSMPDREQIIVPRWHKIGVTYITIMIDPEDKDKFKLSSPIEEKLQGMKAFVFAHETDHGQAKYIYEF